MNKIKIIFIVLILVSCSNDVEPIKYGSDNCEECRMLIVDRKFGTELITDKSKIYKFDSIECLAFYYKKNKPENAKLWVTNFSNQNLIPLDSAKFFVSTELVSPMGLNISAFKTEEEKQLMMDSYKGKVLDWDSIVQYVFERWHE